ncbi:hypothetical protein ACFQHO_11245 [Actinomadura yumaensis]|uniref:hypothetical protein n=1 Tax=Actinomadura yumaensis TaxID=111807 RepID=UPI0036233BA2
MRGVRDEPPLRRHQALQPAEHGVEGVGEVLELARRGLEEIRSLRSSPDRRRAVAVMVWTGRSTRPAIHQASSTDTTAKIARATSETTRSCR